MEKTKMKALLENLSPMEKDDLYRTLWVEYIKEDVENCVEENGYNLDDDMCRFIAEKFVFDGEYDCNLSHWDNILNLIEEYGEG